MGLGAVIEGFIIAVIITIFLAVIGVKSVFGLPISVVGFLIAGIVVGYIVYGGIIDGLVNGAFIGVIGAVILWILSLFKSQIAAFSAELSSYVGLVTLQEVVVMIVVGAIGGLIGGIIVYLTGATRSGRNWSWRRW
ncbi:DUF5518 domain-containing protein [Methanobacterium sp. MBAC-LM]|uniref:DUF5518 domain-containing protein n=1 Tax=Methanobacterium sp. MBAC-LM TaxID=3412034 RepID=UPI003C795A8B